LTSESKVMSVVLCDPVARFNQSFPQSLLESIVGVLRRIHAESPSVAQSVARQPHDRDIHGAVRRALVESELECLVADHPPIIARIVTNRSGNTHVVLESQGFIFTESFVRTPTKVVRWAAHREADSFANYPLFKNSESPDAIDPGAKFSAVLLHGHSRRSRSELGFAVVRFPSPGFKGYLPDQINLIERFPIAPPVVEPDAMEEIPDALEPQIRTDQPDRKEL
jgi:hypothetical protein